MYYIKIKVLTMNKDIIIKIYKNNYTNNLYYCLNKKYNNKIKNINDIFIYIDISIKDIKSNNKNISNDYLIKNYLKLLKGVNND